MTAIHYLHEAIELDFIATCAQLAEARRRQRGKDSTSNRASVTECQALIDAVLDMHLAAECTSPPRTQGDDPPHDPRHDAARPLSTARNQASVIAGVVGRSNSAPS